MAQDGDVDVLLEQVQTVLQDCETALEAESSIADLDEMLHSLRLCHYQVGRQTAEDGGQPAGDLLELHTCLSQLCVLFETRILIRLTVPSNSLTGRPRKLINLSFIELLRDLRFTWQQIADILMVSRSTLWRRLSELGMSFHPYSNITDSELDSIMETLVRDFPRNGIIMMWGHLKSVSIFVSRQRVHDSLMRVSPLLVQQRRSTAVRRRVYSVPSPNFLWHIDGLHCLIRWKIVIHGGIDGYSRRVVYLHASNNNRAETVYRLFQGAVFECGWPSRVRSDKGGENYDVARAMLSIRGTGRRSHITGSSVHNQRIERLWRDTFRCVCHFYYTLFYEMEDCALLDVDSDADVFALHYVYLPRINKQLYQFKRGWNMHPLRTEGGLSPLELWNRGLLATSPQWQEEISCGLTVTELYGVENDNILVHDYNFDHGGIVVPDVNVNLTEEQKLYLKDHYNPMGRSEHNAVDIYLQVKEFVNSV